MSESGVPHDTEIEAKLVVFSQPPGAVIDSICRLRSIGRHTLASEPEKRIHDIYFDSKDLLRNASLAIRLRDASGSLFLTLKGRAHTLAGGAIQRMEIEEPWSEHAVATVLEAVRGFGVVLPHDSLPSETNPVSALHALGLDVIQDRETIRRIRNVVPMSPTSRSNPVAELAVDSVTYRFGPHVFRHHEVEVELTGAHDAGAVDTITAELRRAYGDTLRPWRHNKLSTGRALERLSGTAPRLADAEGNVLPQTYGIIDAMLSERQE